MRTLRLVEYQPREVRLRVATVAAIAASSAFEIVPTWRKNTYRLTSLGYVGVWQGESLRVVVEPKIPWANVAHMLETGMPHTDWMTPERGATAFDWLVRQFARLLQKRAANGLPRSYVEVAEQGPFLHGRLDVAAQVRDGPTARDRFHVQHDDFTTASPLHRFVKHVGLAVLASPLLLPSTVANLREALLPYADITPSLQPPHAANAEPLLTLANLIHAGLQPSTHAGPTQGPTFFVNMATVFERYVTRGLQVHFPAMQAQREFCYHAPVAGQPQLVGRPDCTLGTRAVLDVKWKTLDDAPPATDVQQVLAYAVGLGCRAVRLVYPGCRSRVWTYSLPGDVQLRIHTLRVVGDVVKCQAALTRLARTLH